MRVYACAGQSHSSLLVITRMCSPAPCLLHPLTNLALPSLFMADAPYRTPIEEKKKLPKEIWGKKSAIEESQGAVFLKVAGAKQRQERGKRGGLKLHLVSSQMMSFWCSACFL